MLKREKRSVVRTLPSKDKNNDDSARQQIRKRNGEANSLRLRTADHVGVGPARRLGRTSLPLQQSINAQARVESQYHGRERASSNRPQGMLFRVRRTTDRAPATDLGQRGGCVLLQVLRGQVHPLLGPVPRVDRPARAERGK